MDAKGRLAVPTRHREQLQELCAGQLTVTKHPEGCLMVFPRPAWETFRDRIAAGIEGHLWGLLDHGDFTSANIRIYGQIPASAKNRHRVVRRAYADLWDRLFEGAMESGELRSDSSTAVIRLFVIGALNWTVEWYNPQRGSFQDFSRQLTEIVFDGVLARKAP